MEWDWRQNKPSADMMLSGGYWEEFSLLMGPESSTWWLHLHWCQRLGRQYNSWR
jgi:hypothetical protein